MYSQPCSNYLGSTLFVRGCGLRFVSSGVHNLAAQRALPPQTLDPKPRFRGLGAFFFLLFDIL